MSAPLEPKENEESVVEKCTDHLKRTIVRAKTIAKEANAPAIAPEHLFLALLAEKGSIGRALFLQEARVTETTVKRWITPRETAKIHNTPLPLIGLTEEAQRIIIAAMQHARAHQHCYVGTEHLLLALLVGDHSWLQQYTVRPETVKRVRNVLHDMMKSVAHFSEATPSYQEPSRERKKKTSALSHFCRDLTAEARAGHLDPVIGREDEIERTMIILARRTKNNPILLGEAGVGKTAIVEGLAVRIAQGTVPAGIQGKRIMALDVGAVVAGTVWRGEFEGRMQQLLRDIEQSTDVILFIDEIHTIMGAGSASGSLDAANFLKPALARGTLHCIGATTVRDYKKTIEADPALERRFQSIMVEEPTQENARAILEGLRPLYEKHHNVRITPEAVSAAVALAKRYFPTAMLPDKAIDLLDEAAAAFQLHKEEDPAKREQKRIKALHVDLQEKKEHAIERGAFDAALVLQKEEEMMLQQLLALQKTIQQTSVSSAGRPMLDRDAIMRVVARIVHLPEETIAETPHRLATVSSHLGEHIHGQPRALTLIADTIQRAFSGMSSRQRPRASFIFVGPSGVGKTETAKLLAATLFPGESAFVRVDMGEFAQGFNIAKLIGAPPGYVGYREGTALTDNVKNHPACVVLFDEIEKAHPDALHLLLGLLDEGMLTDATGKRISFREAIIIFTSNIGTREMSTQEHMGFVPGATFSENTLKRLVQKTLPLEFVNRLDALVPFAPLGEETITTLVDRACQSLATSLVERGTTLTIANDVMTHLAKHAFLPDEGARAVHRIMQEKIENPLAKQLLNAQKRAIHVRLKNGTIVFV
ncbi:MAG: ATP-dependent Clp protease ATP-binding subunit [bacterium]|nr:ATP-dependent Clp protease ATP-binding subunit [bacterium]